jgi:hypothetical protein
VFVRPSDRARRRPWGRVVAILAKWVLVVALVLVFGLGVAAFWRPAWYQPATVDWSRLKSDKRDLATLADGIGAALNRGEPIEFEIREDQFNRWIAARAEIWPGVWDQLGGVSFPQVKFLAGNCVRLGATVRNGGISVVLSIDAQVWLTPQGTRVGFSGARSGALPIPGMDTVEVIRANLRRHELLRTSPRGGVVVLNKELIWPNGRRRFTVGRLEIAEGVAHVSFVPVQD